MIKTTPTFRRLLAFTTSLTMVLPALPATSFAQDASAPPSRVGQIASINGNVSFNGSGSGGWAAAAINYPVSAGDSLYTQDSSQAAIALDSSQLTLSSDTELQVTALDQNNFAATESQGELALAINYLQPGQSFTVTTPRGAVDITQNGQYDILAGDANNPTVVNVFLGAATVTDPGATLTVAAGQSGVLTGTDQTVAQLGQAQEDSFTNTVFAASAPPPPSYAPPVVEQMSGATELSSYGTWDQSPQYGAVWYPNVGSGWAPYREGHWADIQPWGWTWVESEPWGFAPFHYGRWVDDNDRWGWAPAPAYSDDGGYGPSYQPIYAPAVVSFFGVALAAGITIAALSSGNVGWVPLAPDEPYYPTYRCPPSYIRQINVVNVRNINVVNVTNNYYGGNYTPDKLANRRGATYVPAAVMSRGDRVSSYGHAVSPTMLAAARPIDTGFGAHAQPGQAAAYRLPTGVPLAHQRPGTPPRPTAFAQRHSLPPATVSHEPFNGHPSAMTVPHEISPPHEGSNPMQPANRPSFATEPGYHAPPPPPTEGQHLGQLPPAGNYHPQEQVHSQTPQTYHPVEAYHPPAQTYHPPAQTYHPPTQAYHPPVDTYHPPAQTYHPPVQQFHPEQQQFHPAVQQFHPQEMQHTMSAHRPEPAHNGGPDKRPQ